MASFASLKSAIYDREERKQHYQAHIKGLNAYERHKKFLNDYVKYYGKEKPCGERLPVKTDQDALREGYRFIRTEEDDMDASWEQRLVKRYYDKLFKEYCIADMSKYKTGKVCDLPGRGKRWKRIYFYQRPAELHNSQKYNLITNRLITLPLFLTQEMKSLHRSVCF